MGENINHLEEFQKNLKQQQTNAIGSINEKLYNDLIKTAEIAETTEDDTKFTEITNNLRERFKSENLNEVTDLFIYCQGFLSRNEEPVPMPSKLCISLGKLFTNENLHYTTSKVYSVDEVNGGSALSFLGYLAMYEQHRSYVLDFIKGNFEGFSQNKKTECVFQLKELFPDNDLAKKIIEESGITEYKLVFSTEEDSSSRPVTFKFRNEDDNKEKQSTSNSKISIQINEKENIKTNTEEIKKLKYPWWQFWEK